MHRDHTQVAKVTRPAADETFARSRLFKALDGCLTRRAAFVSGPPGSGKTTLLSSYIEARNLASLWYKMDAGDDDPASFFYYLGLAAKKAAPRKRLPLPLLTPEHLPSIDVFARRYFEKLGRKLAPPSLIVLDGYEAVPDRSPLHDAVRAGVESLPDGIVMVMASRSALPAALAGLKAGGSMRVVGWEDLRLTPGECAGIAKLHSPGGLPRKTIKELCERTRGWVAGVTLIMESIPDPGERIDPGAAFDPERIFDYFAGEFFDRLDKNMVSFLLKSSFLPSMTPESVASLTGVRISSKLLSLLHRNNLFTEKLSMSRPVYRYHALFREFLLARARKTFSKRQASELRCRAAILLEKAEQQDEALELYSEAGDLDSMVRLILRQAPSMARQGRTRTLESWIRRLPERSPDEEPRLHYWLGACRMSADLDEALAGFEKAFDRFDEIDDEEGKLASWAGAVDAILYRYGDMNPLDRWIEWLDERMDKDGAFPSKDVEARAAGCMAGALMYRQMQRSDVEAWFDRAWRAARETGDPERLLHAGFSLIYYYLWTGHPARGKLILDTLRSAVPPAASTPLVLLMFKVTESQLTIQLGRYDESSRSIREGLDIGRRSGVHLKDSLLCSQGVYLALTLGDVKLARSYFEKMEESALPVRGKLEDCLYDHLKTWLHLWEGDAGAAVESAERAFDCGTGCGSPFIMAFGHHGIACALFERGDAEKARYHVNESIRLARECRSPAHEYHSLITAAYFELKSGREEEGVEVLGQALELGSKYDYVHYPIWWLPSMLELVCTTALEKGIEPQYAGALVRARGFTPREPPLEMEAWPWTVKVRTLGRFDISLEDRPLRFSRKVRKKPLELMKVLIALGGNGVEEEKISGAMWESSRGASAHRSFSTTLHRLRRLLGDEKLLELQGGRLSVDGSRVWVDAAAFERAFEKAEKALGAGRMREAQSLHASAVDLYRGHFLAAEPGAPWAAPMRERLRIKFVQAVSRLGDFIEKEGRFEEALERYGKALEIDEESDELYRRALRCCRELGLGAEAARIRERRRSTTPARPTLET